MSNTRYPETPIKLSWVGLDALKVRPAAKQFAEKLGFDAQPLKGQLIQNDSRHR